MKDGNLKYPDTLSLAFDEEHRQVSQTVRLEENRYIFKGDSSVKLLLIPSEKGVHSNIHSVLEQIHTF